MDIVAGPPSRWKVSKVFKRCGLSLDFGWRVCGSPEGDGDRQLLSFPLLYYTGCVKSFCGLEGWKDKRRHGLEGQRTDMGDGVGWKGSSGMGGVGMTGEVAGLDLSQKVQALR